MKRHWGAAVAPGRRAIRRTLADIWRTQHWARWLVSKSGLPLLEVERDLWRLRYPGEPEGDSSNFLRQYMNGETFAFLVVQRSTATSWVLLSEALDPGAVDRFLCPAFDLVEEIELRDNPQLASERFVGRVASEIRTGLRASTDLRDQPMFSPPDLVGDSTGGILERFFGYSRLQRTRNCLLRLSYPMTKSPFGVVCSSNGSFCVRLETDVESELKSIREDADPLSKIGVSLALYIEAGECDAFDRRERVAEEFGEFLNSFATSERAPPFAGQLVELLRGDFRRRICASYDPFEEVLGRQIGVRASVLAASSAVSAVDGDKGSALELRLGFERLTGTVANLRMGALQGLNWRKFFRGVRVHRKRGLPNGVRRPR